MIKTYPRIEKMMAGYINMDAYEIAGSSNLNDQVAYYTTRVSPKALRALVLELDDFERQHSHNLTDDFEDEFDYGANISDAKAFFDLVRSKVDTTQGEGEKTETTVGQQKSVNGPFGGGLSKDAYQNLVSIMSLCPSDTSGLVRTGSLGKCLEGGFPPGWTILNLTSSGVVENLSAWSKSRESVLDNKYKILPKFGAISQLFELQLLHMVQSTPEHLRITKEYTGLLEKLLELKGADLKRNEAANISKALNFSIEELLQLQDSKTVR